MESVILEKVVEIYYKDLLHGSFKIFMHHIRLKWSSYDDANHYLPKGLRAA